MSTTGSSSGSRRTRRSRLASARRSGPVRARVVELRPDIVHAHSSYGGAFARWRCRGAGPAAPRLHTPLLRDRTARVSAPCPAPLRDRWSSASSAPGPTWSPGARERRSTSRDGRARARHRLGRQRDRRATSGGPRRGRAAVRRRGGPAQARSATPVVRRGGLALRELARPRATVVGGGDPDPTERPPGRRRRGHRVAPLLRGLAGCARRRSMSTRLAGTARR